MLWSDLLHTIPSLVSASIMLRCLFHLSPAFFSDVLSHSPQLSWFSKSLMVPFTLKRAVDVTHICRNTQAATCYQLTFCPCLEKGEENAKAQIVYKGGEPPFPDTGSCSLFLMGDFKYLQFANKQGLEKVAGRLWSSALAPKKCPCSSLISSDNYFCIQGLSTMEVKPAGEVECVLEALCMRWLKSFRISGDMTKSYLGLDTYRFWGFLKRKRSETEKIWVALISTLRGFPSLQNLMMSIDTNLSLVIKASEWLPAWLFPKARVKVDRNNRKKAKKKKLSGL